jgi:tetratricopeptide (TPR) repeat protein
MKVPFDPRAWRSLLVASLILTCAAVAQAACDGPPALAATLRADPTTENAIALGNWFAGHKQFDCAYTTFRTALEADPQSAQLNYLVGLALIGEGKASEAVAALQDSIRLQPDAIKPHLILAHVFDKQEDHDKAIEQWRQALDIDPNSIPALEGMSANLLAKEDYVGVVTLLKDAPRTEKLAINLSQALGVLNFLNEAKQVLTDAMTLSPNSVPLASAMTVVLVKQLRYQEAINLLQQTVDANPGNLDAELQLFRLLVLTNHINQARPMGPKLLAARPHDPEVLYLNGIVERIMGDYPQAKAHLEEAVASAPNFFNSRYNLGMVLVFLHEWPEAAEQLQKAIALGAIEPQVHFELAKAYRGLGQDDKAQQEMTRYQTLKKDDETALEASESAAQGDKDLSEGKVKDAIDEYRAAAEGQPGNAEYKFKLALALNAAGDMAAERTALEEAVNLNPKLPAAQKQLGFVLSRSGDVHGAIEHFRLAVQASPAWVDAWINLAGELAEAGQFSEARSAVANAIRLDPANPQARELSDQLARDPSAQLSHP